MVTVAVLYVAALTPCDVMPQWLGVVTVAVLYNVLVIVGRTVFWELQNLAPRVWFALDYVCDSIYLLDMAIKAHESK